MNSNRSAENITVVSGEFRVCMRIRSRRLSNVNIYDNVRYVGERSGDLMSQTGCERLAVVVKTGSEMHLGKWELIRNDVIRADPVFFVVVIDVVPRVRVNDFRNVEFVIVVQTYAFR
jgi:hypothetical protein